MTEEKKPESNNEETAPAKVVQPVRKAAASSTVATLTPVTTEKPEKSTAAAEPEAAGELTCEEQAKAVMYRFMMQNAALGFLPIPVIDVVTIGGTQLAMLAGISKIYGVDFKQNKVKPVIASLLGALGYDFAVRMIAGALFKSIPVLGFVAGIATMPLMGAASTYAVGKMFIQHFESGGTFINFNVDEAKKYFVQYYKEGVQEAIGMKDKLLKPRASKTAAEVN